MSDSIGRGVIKIDADASGVKAGVESAKRSIDDLGTSAKNAGDKASKGIGGIGDGSDKASKKVEQSTKSMIASINRQIAAAEAGSTSSRKYYESIAAQRGVSADVLKPYLDQLEKASKKSGEFAEKIRSVSAGLGTMAGIAATVATAAFGALIKNAIDAGDAANKASQKIGITVESLTALQYAASLADINSESLTSSMVKLDKAIAGAGDGSKLFVAAFSSVGVSVKDARGNLLGADEVLLQLSDRFKSMPDGAEKSALALQLFGKSGAEMIPLLNSGSESIRQLEEDAKRLGVVMSAEAAQNAEKFNDQLTVLKTSASGLGISIANDMLPSLNRIVAAMIEAQKEGGLLNAVWVGLGGVASEVLSAANSLEKQREVLRQRLDAGLQTGGLSKHAQADLVKQIDTLTEKIKGAADSKDLLKLGDPIVGIDIIDANGIADTLGGVKMDLSQFSEESLKAAKAAAELKKQISDTLKTLEQQAATVGYSSDKLKIYELYSKGATKADLERARAALGIVDAYKQQSDMIESINADLDKSFKETVAQIETSVNLPIDEYSKNAKEMEKLNDQIGQSLSDALMKGGKNAAEYLQDLFRTLVLRPILDPIAKGLASVVTGIFSGSAMADTGSSSMGIIDSLKNVYSAITGGFDKLAIGVQSTMIDVGSWMASSGNALMKSAGESIIHGSASVGTAAGYAAGAAAGYAVGNYISGGYSISGMNSNTPVIAGTVIGSIVGGPIGGAIGGALGGIVNKAFGQGEKKTTDYGISGTFASNGSSVAQFSDWKRSSGWLSSGSKGASMSNVSPEFAQFLNGAINVTTDAVKRYAGLIGLSADAVDGFSQQIRISLKDLTPEQQQKAISDAISGFSDAMVQSAYAAIEPFAKTGETASDTLTRLGDSITTVNNTFDTLGLKLMDVSVSGAAAASALLDAFGGLDTFTKSTSFYYENFYSQTEKTAKVTEQLTASMSALGYTLPSTREGFRALVEAATVAGDPALIANLLALAPAFASITDAVSTAAQQMDTAQLASAMSGYIDAALQRAIDKAKAKTADAYAALEKSVSAEKTAIDSARSIAKEQIKTIQDVFDTLGKSIGDLYGEVGSTKTGSVAQGSAFIQQAIASAQATGYLPDSSQLQEAIASVRSGLSGGAYASQFEADRAKLLFAGQLQQLQNLAGGSLTGAQGALAGLDSQAAALDKLLSNAKGQIDALNGIDDSVLSVRDAINNLASAMSGQKVAQWIFDNKGKWANLTVTQQSALRKDMLASGNTAALGQITGGTPYDQAAIVAELRALREEQARQAQVMRSEQAQMRKTIEQWNGEGMPASRGY